MDSDEVRRQECAFLDLVLHLPLLYQPTHVYNLLRGASTFSAEQLDRLRGALNRMSGGGGVGVKRLLALVDDASMHEGDQEQARMDRFIAAMEQYEGRGSGKEWNSRHIYA